MTQETPAEQLIWLLHVSRTMFASRDADRLLTLALDAFIELTGAERGFVLLQDRDTGKLVQTLGRTAGGTALEINESRFGNLAMEVFRDKRAVFATESATGTGIEDGAPRRSMAEMRLKMLACAPLSGESGTLGVLYADGRSHDERGLQRRAAEILADHAGAALDNARMFERASNDLLTGLPNNSYFLMQLGKVMRQAAATSQAGLLLLDLDAFKRVNQAAGAETGDRALIDVAHTLREVLRTDGLVSRYGSDKFAILLAPDDTTAIALRLRDVAERARAAVGTKTYHAVQLSACIGGIAFPVAGSDTAQELIATADDVLAKARARGPGQVEIV